MDITEEAIDAAVEAMEDGGTILYPTETCYGIGCDALNTDAVSQIYEIKKRPRRKKLTVIVADLAMAEQYCTLTPLEKAICNAFMPGPLTLLAEKKDNVPDVLNTTFAFRVSSDQTCTALSEKLGKPVVATSANLSGQPSNYSVATIDPVVRGAVDHVLDGGTLVQRSPSTILEMQNDIPVIHREGPVSRQQIESVIERFDS